jgi:hypothetical protein
MYSDLAYEFETRKPWVTRFVIDGVEYGGQFDAMNDVRLSQFFGHFPNVHRILELGALEGGHSLGLANNPNVERVVSIEGRQANIEKARFVVKVFGAGKIEFVEANLEQADLAGFGRFDAVFCVGLLYHLPRPWELIARCADTSPNLFIWTHYAPGEGNTTVSGYRGSWYKESGLRDPLSGLSDESFWPTLESLNAMLENNGFSNIDVVENQLEHPHGPAITLASKA